MAILPEDLIQFPAPQGSSKLPVTHSSLMPFSGLSESCVCMMYIKLQRHTYKQTNKQTNKYVLKVAGHTVTCL